MNDGMGLVPNVGGGNAMMDAIQNGLSSGAIGAYEE